MCMTCLVFHITRQWRLRGDGVDLSHNHWAKGTEVRLIDKPWEAECDSWFTEHDVTLQDVLTEKLVITWQSCEIDKQADEVCCRHLSLSTDLQYPPDKMLLSVFQWWVQVIGIWKRVEDLVYVYPFDVYVCFWTCGFHGDWMLEDHKKGNTCFEKAPQHIKPNYTSPPHPFWAQTLRLKPIHLQILRYLS